MNIFTDDYIALGALVTHDGKLNLDLARLEIGNRPLGNDFYELERIAIIESQSGNRLIDQQTKLVCGLTTTQIESSCLSNLLSVDIHLDRAKQIIPRMRGFFYWHTLYRLATEYLSHNHKTELEILCVRTLQVLVQFKTITDADDDEVISAIKNNLERAVTLLLNWR